VTRNNRGKWLITWFKPDSLPIEGRMILFGGGKVLFDVRKGKQIKLTNKELTALGLKE
jgi:hypothetical protein